MRRLSMWTFAAGLLAATAGFAPADDGPPAIAVPPGHDLTWRVSARGVQVYKAAEAPGGGLAWTPDGPLATLYDAAGAAVGAHFEGPTWDAADGSRAAHDPTEPIKTAPAPDPAKDIPWLLVKLRPDGAGALARATYVRRTRTAGGLPPATPPKRPGTRVGVPYSATYLFYGKRD